MLQFQLSESTKTRAEKLPNFETRFIENIFSKTLMQLPLEGLQ